MATGPITWEDLTKLDFVFKRDIADRVKTDGVPIDEAGKIIFPNEEIPTYPTLSSENVWTQSALLAVGKTSTVVSQRTVKLYSLSPNYNALLAGITWGVEGFIQYSYQEETLSNGPSGPYLPLSTATNFVSDRYSPDFLPRVLITPSFKDNGTIISAAEVRSKLNAPSSYNVPGVTNQSKFYRLEYTDINFPFTIDYGRGIISFLKAVPRITRTSGLVIDLKDTSAWNVWMDGYVYTGKTLQTVLQEGAGNTGPSGAQGTQGVSGMTGATGPPAATGPSGAQGIQGNAGNPGVTGATGPSGAHGHSGAQGPSGTSATMKGDTGASGPQGIAGTPSTTLGPTGATGPSGPQGLPGTFAAMGNTGPTGASGAQGRQGVSGVTGATGPSGAQGTAGQSGVTGATGPSGVQGNTGNPGMTGPTGPSGVQGNTGNPGVTGATGPSGAQGNTGNPGVTGATGPSGAQGIQGVQGASGEQGIQGVQGASGERGFSGASGERGFSGASGERGIQGISGPRGFTGFNGSNGTDGATGPEGRSFVTLLGLNGAQILTPTSVRMTNLNHVVLSAEKFDRNQSAIYAQCTVPGNGTYNLQFGIRVDSDPNFTGYFFRITATQYRCLYGISADPDPSGSTPIKGSTNYSNDAIFSIIVDRTITRYLVNGVVVASTTNIPSDIAGYELYLSPVISDFIEVTNIRMYPTGLVGPSGPQGPQGPLAQVSNYVAQEIFHLACQETFSYESGNGTVVVPLGGRPSTLGRGDLVQIRTATNPAVQTRFLNPLSGNYWYVIGTIAGNGFGVTPTRYASTYTPTALEVGQNMLTTINTDYSRTKGVGTVPYVVLPGQTCLSVGLTNSANNGTDSTVFAGKPITFADANGGVSGSVVLTGTVYYLLQANYGGSVQRFTISRTRGGTVY